MTIQDKIQESLEQLYHQTGIRFAIEEGASDEEETLLILKNMITNGQGSTSKEGFLRGLLLGLFSQEELMEGIHRFHMHRQGIYLPVLMETKKSITSTEQSIFSQFFSSGAETLIQTDENHILLLRELSHVPSEEAVFSLLSDFVSTLETETMVPVHLSFDRIANSLDELADIYTHLTTAMEIGNIFSSSERIFSYHQLGMGKLIYRLSREDCEEYLSDQFRGLHREDFDDETLHTIYTFLDSGLSIAECARKLYLHRNTLIYRLDKIAQQTGLDIRRFDDAMICKTALLISTYLSH